MSVYTSSATPLASCLSTEIVIVIYLPTPWDILLSYPFARKNQLNIETRVVEHKGDFNARSSFCTLSKSQTMEPRRS